MSPVSPVSPVTPVSPVGPVSSVSPVSQVRLAHLWVDFRVIFSRNKGQLWPSVARPKRLSTPLCHTHSESSGHEDSI